MYKAKRLRNGKKLKCLNQTFSAVCFSFTVKLVNTPDKARKRLLKI